MAKLVILATSDNTVYVFDEGDERADMQYTVCIGANLDVERFTVPAEAWEDRRARLASDIEVVDCRKG